MKSEEIINSMKTILGMDVKPAKEVEVIEEEVVLAEDAKSEEAPAKAEKAEAPVMSYVTEEQLSKVVSSLTAMIEQAMEAINSANSNAVPQGLSKEEPKEEVKEEVELAKEEEVKEFVHDPEAVIEKKAQILHSNNRRLTYEDRVMQRLFGN